MLPDGRRCTQVHRVQNHGLPSWPRPWVTAYGVVERRPVDRVAPGYDRRNGVTIAGVTCTLGGVFRSTGHGSACSQASLLRLSGVFGILAATGKGLPMGSLDGLWMTPGRLGRVTGFSTPWRGWIRLSCGSAGVS